MGDHMKATTYIAIARAFALGLGLLLCWDMSAEAGQWCVTMSCPACAAHGFRSSGRECFSSKEACESRVAQVRSSGPTGASYSACTEEGGSAGSGSSGDLLTDSSRNLVQGMMNGNAQQMGIGMMGIGAAALIQGMQPDPAAEARRRAAEAARAAEQKRRDEEAARQAEETKRRLLGETGSSDPSSLSLMGVEPAPDLQLMTDDASTSAPAANNRNTAAAAPVKHSEAFTTGFNDASQCYSQNAGARCAGITGDQWQSCLSDYRAGYQVGDKQRRQAMDEAYHVGQSAGASGLLADAASDPRALGPCRTQWIESYNRGYQETHARLDVGGKN